MATAVHLLGPDSRLPELWAMLWMGQRGERGQGRPRGSKEQVTQFMGVHFSPELAPFGSTVLLTELLKEPV